MRIETYSLRGVAPVGTWKGVGRAGPIVIYEPVDSGFDTDLVRDLTTYHDTLALLEAGTLREARSSFEGVKGDPVSAAYRARIERIP
jgi:hypothetical protein